MYFLPLSSRNLILNLLKLVIRMKSPAFELGYICTSECKTSKILKSTKPGCCRLCENRLKRIMVIMQFSLKCCKASIAIGSEWRHTSIRMMWQGRLLHPVKYPKSNHSINLIWVCLLLNIIFKIFFMLHQKFIFYWGVKEKIPLKTFLTLY